MKPGRDLDVLVAQKVVGLSLEYINCDGTHIWYSHDAGDYFPTPAYSTDIAAAWEVVKKITSQSPVITDWQFSMILPLRTMQSFNGCFAKFCYGGGKFESVGESAPHAICLAALKAVGAI